MIILGIDPGSISGAYGALDGKGSVVDVGDLPVVNRQVNASALWLLMGWLQPDVVIVEDVWAFPKQGIASSFRFGVSVGIVRGVIAAREVPVVYVTPGKWKKHFRLGNDGEQSRELAIRTWPSCRKLSRKKDHGRAEALLLAKYRLENDSA